MTGFVLTENTQTEGRIMVELKPCPFCGGQAQVRTMALGIAAVYCNVCHASSGAMSNKERAVEAWNWRTPTEPPKEEKK